MIFLDMDGVLVDFVNPALCLHGIEPKGFFPRWLNEHPGQYDMAVVLGITSQEFWQPIDDAGPDFWAGLQPYPWFDDILEQTQLAAEFHNTGWCILSTPRPHPGSFAGKCDWLQARFGPQFHDYCLTPRKELLAAPGCLLIDDASSTTTRFCDAGGDAITFPQIWNKEFCKAADCWETVKKQIQNWAPVPF